MSSRVLRDLDARGMLIVELPHGVALKPPGRE